MLITIIILIINTTLIYEIFWFLYFILSWAIDVLQKTTLKMSNGNYELTATIIKSEKSVPGENRNTQTNSAHSAY